ncbi:MAG: SDR family oxidoreductase [Candidatus Zixiibacteriota bacterium]
MLEEKSAFVTGAGRGFGKAIAIALAREGSDVAVSDINFTSAEECAHEIVQMGRRSFAASMDVSDLASVRKGFSDALRGFNSIDILVNNAAITDNFARVVDMPEGDWNKEIGVNLSGAFYCIKQVLPNMINNKWGRIINISSVAAINGGFGLCSYSSSKAALLGLTKTVALEYARDGITSNVLVMGTIRTEGFMAIREDLRDRLVRRIPIRRPGECEELAEAVIFVASEKAGYINGAQINISGGLELLSF